MKTLAPYFGGKHYAARTILPRIAAIKHDGYFEPFVGMGGVFLRRPEPARVEAINDAAGDIVNLFRIVKHHPQALLDELRLQLVSKEEFHRHLAVDPDTLTDVQRAARFLYLQRLAYGGKPNDRTFPARSKRPNNMSAADLVARILPIHDRLAKVTVDRRDFAEFMVRYDRPGALFYLDPPYVGYEQAYLHAFEPGDFERLAETLAGLKGRFLMSIGDHPTTRRVFGRWDITQVEFPYFVKRGKGKELLIEG